jgi:hypothetical protein
LLQGPRPEEESDDSGFDMPAPVGIKGAAQGGKGGKKKGKGSQGGKGGQKKGGIAQGVTGKSGEGKGATAKGKKAESDEEEVDDDVLSNVKKLKI